MMKRWSVLMVLLPAVAAMTIHSCSQPPSVPPSSPVTKPTSRPSTQSTRPALVLKDPSILVEKSMRRLTLFDGGKVTKTYRICTGRATGDKEKEGDLKTPEGEFYICYKNPESKFTLSLGLSYPSDEDAARGLRDGLITAEQHAAIIKAIAEHVAPPWDTPLGGEIMIHGAGASRDGTLGCVGMDDGDICELYPALPEGTPVKIVP